MSNPDNPIKPNDPTNPIHIENDSVAVINLITPITRSITVHNLSTKRELTISFIANKPPYTETPLHTVKAGQSLHYSSPLDFKWTIRRTRHPYNSSSSPSVADMELLEELDIREKTTDFLMLSIGAEPSFQPHYSRYLLEGLAGQGNPNSSHNPDKRDYYNAKT